MEQLALDQVRLLRLAQPDRAVCMAHIHVHFLIVEDQLDLHVGIKLQKFLHLVGQPSLPKSDRGRDPEFA